QLPDNYVTCDSRDSALVSLLLCAPLILFACREIRASNLIMLIVASERQCFACLIFLFPLGSSTMIPVMSGRSENGLQHLYPTS
ncbi:hypothetical protein P692DRAFT_20895653, partial [Suillus brevipes Sb2]